MSDSIPQLIDPSVQRTQARSPWVFVPTLYFTAGLPYVLVNSVAVVFYKKLGVDNAQIAFWTSLLYLPWVIKMAWGPLVDLYATKRRWIVYSQAAMAVGWLGVACALQLPNFFGVSLVILAIVACLSATYDTAADGFYMLALGKEAQAFFIGVRSVFYRLAAIFGSGVLVFWAGRLEVSLSNISLSWTIVLIITALISALLVMINYIALPTVEGNATPPVEGASAVSRQAYFDIFKAYFQQKKVGAVLAFIVLYRLGEAMLVKLTAPFLLDKLAAGGLELSTSTVGLVYGTVGSIALVMGGILGGFLIFKYGIQRCLLPMALALNLPNLFYVYMAYSQPSVVFVYPLVAIEQFGYGLGTAAYSVYMMYTADDRYKTSHFAISTGLMALGMMLPGFVSGYLQQAVGYPIFFSLTCLLTIPGMLAIAFIPIVEEESPSIQL